MFGSGWSVNLAFKYRSRSYGVLSSKELNCRALPPGAEWKVRGTKPLSLRPSSSELAP